MSKIYEFTRKDLLQGTDLKNIDRSKQVHGVFYKSISDDYVMHFDVNSASDPGTKYQVDIRLVDYPDVADDPDLSIRDKVRLAIAGDLKIRCSCPAFRWWGYEYINTELDTHEGDPQTIYPHIRNPRLEGVLCKHAYKALSAMPMNYMKVVSDLTRRERDNPPPPPEDTEVNDTEIEDTIDDVDVDIDQVDTEEEQ